MQIHIPISYETIFLLFYISSRFFFPCVCDHAAAAYRHMYLYLYSIFVYYTIREREEATTMQCILHIHILFIAFAYMTVCVAAWNSVRKEKSGICRKRRRPIENYICICMHIVLICFLSVARSTEKSVCAKKFLFLCSRTQCRSAPY